MSHPHGADSQEAAAAPGACQPAAGAGHGLQHRRQLPRQDEEQEDRHGSLGACAGRGPGLCPDATLPDAQGPQGMAGGHHEPGESEGRVGQFFCASSPLLCARLSLRAVRLVIAKVEIIIGKN